MQNFNVIVVFQLGRFCIKIDIVIFANVLQRVSVISEMLNRYFWQTEILRLWVIWRNRLQFKKDIPILSWSSEIVLTQ